MRNSIPPRPAPPGFTLIEIVVVLALMAVMLAVVAPSMTRHIGYNRSQSAVSQFMQDIAYARALAVRGGRGAALEFTAADRYEIRQEQVGGPATVKTIDLRREYGPVVIQPEAQRIVFNSRGLVTQGAGAYVVRPEGGGSYNVATLNLSRLGTVTRE